MNRLRETLGIGLVLLGAASADSTLSDWGWREPLRSHDPLVVGDAVLTRD